MAKNVQVITHTRGLDKLERVMPDAVDRACGKVANDICADVIANFSPNSPSEPGQPPGIDTGNYKNNIDAKRLKPRRWAARFRTKYAAALEYGTKRMAARPHIHPAVKRQAKRMPHELKITIEAARR